MTSTKQSALRLRFTSILKWIDILVEWQGKIAASLIVIASLQICYEVMMRYLFNAPSTWGLELTIYLCGSTYILAGSYAEFHNAHIRVDLFYCKWSVRTRAFIDLLVTDMLVLFFNGVLVIYGAIWFWEAVTQGITTGTIWDPPAWPMRLILCAGAFFMLLSGFAQFIRNLSMALFKIDLSEPPPKLWTLG
jgi:TRAP-type mannitol/chloroaromatic compound transport system permease small subunit